MITKSVLSSPRSLRPTGHGLRAFLGLFAAMLLCANVCRAAGGGVQDNGAFFSEQARSDAEKLIVETERTLHKDIAIETFKTIPSGLASGVNLQDKAARDRLFEEWSMKQAKQKRVNGVYLLLVKSPAHLHAVVGNETLRQAFTPKDRDALLNLMLPKLRLQQYDEALRDGVNFISATMKSHTNSRARGDAMPVASNPAQSSSGSSGWIIQILVVVAVVWVAIGLLRALSGRMGGGSGVGQTGGGGGGFLSSMVGGMFGAAAGMWMYNQFFSNHGSNSAYGSDHNDPSGGDSGSSGQDSDYTGSGGDFGGDSSGGGDSGGGDFGGGGDSGGGGDF